MLERAHVLLAALALLAPRQASPARDPAPLVAPVRCVSDYLEAVATAAPPRPRGSPAPSPSTGAEPRWNRARSYLAPRAADALDKERDRSRPLAPWVTLGREGAFLGYEVLAVRRAPRGAAVVVARERTARSPEASSTVAACTYLVARVAGTWRIADKRCGRDFSNAEVIANYQGYWDEPDPREARRPPDEWFGEGLE